MKSSRKYYFFTLSFLIVILTGTYACQKNQSEEPAAIKASVTDQADTSIAELLKSESIYHFKEPTEAPAFELPSLDGEKISLAQYRGKVVLLSFWATW